MAAGLGHAPFSLWPVALLGFAALFHLISSVPHPGRLAWAAGVGYFGLTLHWIVEPFLVDIETHGWMAPFALIFLAGGLALFWAGAGWLAKYMAGPRALGFAVALAGAEMLRGHIFTGFPWALPGYVWADTPVRASASVFGAYGLTFLTLAALSLPFALKNRLGGVVSSFGALCVVALPGLVQGMGEADGPTAPSIGSVRILQPNIPQSAKWDREKIVSNFEAKIALTRDGAGAAADMVVWPESAVVYPLDVAGPVLEKIGAAAGTPFITGINRRQDGLWFNSMVVAGPGGEVRETYDKVHLVPFGEYIPFGIPFLRQLAGTASNGFTAGEDVRLIETPLGRALPMICYEGIFPGHAFRAGERADYILILTNDAWFGTFAGPRQHLDIARFRAAEQGLPVVRVANRGISTVIDNRGGIDPDRSLSAGDRGARDVIVGPPLAPTVYSRMGDTPLAVLIILTISGAMVLRRRNRVATAEPRV